MDHIIYLDQRGVWILDPISTLTQRSFLAWKGKKNTAAAARLLKTCRPHRRLLFSLGSAVNVKLLK